MELQVKSSHLIQEFLISNLHGGSESLVLISLLSPHRIKPTNHVAQLSVDLITTFTRILVLINTIIYGVYRQYKIIIETLIEEFQCICIHLGCGNFQFITHNALLQGVLYDLLTKVFIDESCTAKFHIIGFGEGFFELTLVMIIAVLGWFIGSTLGHTNRYITYIAYQI